MPYLAAFKALPWRLIGLAALALAFASLIVALKAERVHSAKLAMQLEKCSQAHAEQQKKVTAAVNHGKQVIADADKRAKAIEAAPLPGNCQTPDAVRSADL